jgi:hypothetical protein
MGGSTYLYPGVGSLKVPVSASDARAWECISNLLPRFLSKIPQKSININTSTNTKTVTGGINTNTYINTNMY